MTREIFYLFVLYIMITFLMQKVFELGIAYGKISDNGKLYAIRKRTVTEGSILKYPFKAASKEPETEPTPEKET